MNSHLIALETKDLLDKVARKSKAKRILASGNSYMFKSLIPPILAGMTGYALADSTLPMTVKILIIIGFVFGIYSQIDSWRLQRRLDAAIELLLQIEEDRNELGK